MGGSDKWPQTLSLTQDVPRRDKLLETGFSGAFFSNMTWTSDVVSVRIVSQNRTFPSRDFSLKPNFEHISLSFAVVGCHQREEEETSRLRNSAEPAQQRTVDLLVSDGRRERVQQRAAGHVAAGRRHDEFG